MGHGLYPLRWRAPGQTCPQAIQRQHGPQYSIQDSIHHTWVTYIHLLYMILSIHLLYFGTIYWYPSIVPSIVLRYHLSIHHTWVPYIHLLYMILSIHLLYFGTIYWYPYIVLRYFLTIYCTLILSNPRSYHFLELGSYKILFNFSVNIASTISSPGTCGTVDTSLFNCLPSVLSNKTT